MRQYVVYFLEGISTNRKGNTVRSYQNVIIFIEIKIQYFWLEWPVIVTFKKSTTLNKLISLSLWWGPLSLWNWWGPGTAAPFSPWWIRPCLVLPEFVYPDTFVISDNLHFQGHSNLFLTFTRIVCSSDITMIWTSSVTYSRLMSTNMVLSRLYLDRTYYALSHLLKFHA